MYIELRDPVYIDSAQASCGSALTLNPNLDVVHTALGDLYYETGEYENAENAYRTALGITPNVVDALTGLGNTYMAQQEPDAAESQYRQAIGLHPGNWSAYNLLGNFLYNAGRYEEAAEEYRRVIALDNTNVFGYSNLGITLTLAGDFSAAAPILQNAVDIGPDATSYSSKGLNHYYMGQYDEAIDSHRTAVELAPKDTLLWSNLGDALWVAGRNDEAQTTFEQAETLALAAIEVNPNSANNQMDLAWISAMLGKTDAAREHIELARSLVPDSPYMHYIDALILIRVGDTESALSALELAVDNGYSVGVIAAEPHLGEIRENPRFRAILERI